ncbi:TRAP transporter substrate-binding protein [Acuticoccus kandeliae]|uniref:TRAP transporter substrate-binding protein n=1 Tax=Acuticoccus kandeliae TaxID=2073160 RepID=UPI0013008266|nr:TRAP transporter substrate-binding protein [Acuticoccus kandeliae]
MRISASLAGALIVGLAVTTQADAQTVLRFGHQNGPDHSLHLSALKFAELVDERTNGEVKVEVYPSAQLGGLNDLWAGVKIGTIDIAGSLPATVAVDLVPSVSIFDAPYMFTGVDHFEKVWTGEIGQEIAAELAEKAGVRLLSMETFGSRQLTANKPILKPEDLAGMKIRAVTLPTFIATIEAMGGTPTPMDFTEVYQGLMSGVIDGQENPPASIYTARFNEVQSHLMMTSHIFGVVTVMMNEGAFSRLTPEQQAILIEAGKEAGIYGNEVAGKQQEEMLAALEASGMTIVGPEDGLDVEAFRTRVREKALPKISANWPEGLMDRVQALAD